MKHFVLSLTTGALLMSGCASSDFRPDWEPRPVPQEVSDKLAATDPGGVADIPALSLEGLPLVPYAKTVVEGPQYLISDDPEYIRVPEAVAMRERVAPGDVRLYVYNVNGLQEPEMPTRISTVITNMGDQAMTFKWKNYAFVPPTTNYFFAGKDGLAQFLSGVAPQEERVLAAGQSMPVDMAMENSIANYNDLVHGFYEFTIDQPAEISVVQTDPDTSSVEANDRIAVPLPTKSKSGAGRGKFLTSNYEVRPADGYTMDTAHGPVQLIVADGEIDPWVVGTESTIDEPAVLKGNYGVMYDIEIPYKSTDGRGLALVTWNMRFNPEAWCGGMAASMEVNDGVYEGGVVRLPEDQLNTRSYPEVIVIQVFPPSEDGVVRLTYSPPGASCLPTPLVFIPVEM